MVRRKSGGREKGAHRVEVESEIDRLLGFLSEPVEPAVELVAPVPQSEPVAVVANETAPVVMYDLPLLEVERPAASTAANDSGSVWDADGHARWLDKVLEADVTWHERGVPAMTEWWVNVITGWSRRRMVWRVGRRGGKSQTLCKLAVCACVWGEHVVPSTDTGTVIVVSYEREDAADRIRTCAELLSLLGWTRTDKGLPKRPREYNVTANAIYLMRDDEVVRRILVVTCTIRSLRGKTAIALLFDEVAFWRDSEGSNPAADILASGRPTIAGQPLAFEIMSSSPWSTIDEHAKAFESGNNNFQTVHVAETWVARPTLTEAETHDLEPDELKWECEYACVPRPAYATSFFDPNAVDAACAVTQ